MKFKNVDTDHTQPVALELYACTVVFRGVIPYNAIGGYQSCEFGGSCFLVLRAEVKSFSTARPVTEYCLKIDMFPSSFLPCHHCTIFNLMLHHLSR